MQNSGLLRFRRNRLHSAARTKMMSPLSEIYVTPDPASQEVIQPQMSLFRENLLYLEEHKYTNIILSVIMVSNAHIFIMGNKWGNWSDWWVVIGISAIFTLLYF